MSLGIPGSTPSAPPPSPLFQSRFLSDEASFDSEGARPEDTDKPLSEPSLNKLHLECYDECVFNDLPQHLVRISNMRLYSRDELWKMFRPIFNTITVDVEEALHIIKSAGEEQLRIHCKNRIKRRLKYAILSHRWGEEEPQFRDMPSKAYGKRTPPASSGYDKLLRFCKKAKEYGCEYVWADTCCINKESSSELEEAIRSMYRWYKDAFVCIVYLAKSSSVNDFDREPWFTRGWTLQELLAPERLRMYGKDWNPICPRSKEVHGDKNFPFPNDKLSEFMLHAIGGTTHIHWKYIGNFDMKSSNFMVSTKMRWASKRKTTRIEDIAYSLLGLFEITMPIAYGEGERAFYRLLEAIAQRSGDPSFFAWVGTCSRYSLALPSSPAAYRTVLSNPYCEHDYAIQKRGIQLRLVVIRVEGVFESDHSTCYALRPKDPKQKSNLTITGQLVLASQAERELVNHSYALGVVDFQSGQSVGGEGHTVHDIGRLLPKKKHFCILMRISRGQVGSGVELACRRIDTKGVLPLIECQSEYQAPLKTALLEHTRYLFI